MRAAATLSSWARSAMPYSASTVREAAEAGRLDGVDADVEERGVHPGDDVGPGEAEHLVAALERGAAEVVGRQVEALHVGAERAVEDDDPSLHRVEVGLCCHGRHKATGRPDAPPPERCGRGRRPSCRADSSMTPGS